MYPAVARMLSTMAHATKTTIKPRRVYFIIDLAFSIADVLPAAKTYIKPPMAIATNAAMPDNFTMNSMTSCPMRKREQRLHGSVSVHGVSGSLQLFPQGMNPPEPGMLHVAGVQSGSAAHVALHPSPPAHVGVLKAALAPEKLITEYAREKMKIAHTINMFFFDIFIIIGLVIIKCFGKRSHIQNSYYDLQESVCEKRDGDAYDGAGQNSF